MIVDYITSKQLDEIAMKDVNLSTDFCFDAFKS